MFPISSRKKLIVLVAALPVLLVGSAWLYIQAMAVFEGEHRTFWRALEWASETLTTTGYGADAQWEHPGMVVFVIAMQFLGVFLVYMLVPLMLLPMLEDRFEMRLPRQAPKRLDDHVVIFRLGPAVERLIQELCDASVPVLVVELDETAARSFLEHRRRLGMSHRRVHVLYERSIPFALDAARLDHARAVVANGSDAENASVVLVAREKRFSGALWSVAEEPNHQSPLLMAGADEVITPRHVLGEALAARASLRIHPRVEGIEKLEGHLELAEIQVDPESFLAGKTLQEAELARRTGATVIGQWLTGNLQVNACADTRLEPRGILLAVGPTEALQDLGSLAQGPASERADGPLIVVGDGEVGKKVVELLRAAHERVLVVDRDRDTRDVDICGDIVDPKILERLDLDRAKGMVLALDTDESTLFATLTVKGCAADLPLVARVNLAENVDRIYRAGADFALSLSEVSAQILARSILGLETQMLDTDLRLVEVSAGPFVGRHPRELNIRGRTSCSVVAVGRGEEILARFDDSFRFEADDAVYICGAQGAISGFLKTYPNP